MVKGSMALARYRRPFAASSQVMRSSAMLAECSRCSSSENNGRGNEDESGSSCFSEVADEIEIIEMKNRDCLRS